MLLVHVVSPDWLIYKLQAQQKWDKTILIFEIKNMNMVTLYTTLKSSFRTQILISMLYYENNIWFLLPVNDTLGLCIYYKVLP